MKAIMEQYAKSVIAAMLALSILAAFWGITYKQRQGLPAIFGGIIENVLIMENVPVSAAFDNYKRSALPQISVKNLYGFKAGKTIPVIEHFIATDGDGRAFSVEIEGVWSEGGTLLEHVVTSEQTLVFEEAGRYWIAVSATDKKGFREEIVIQIFVNKE